MIAAGQMSVSSSLHITLSPLFLCLYVYLLTNVCASWFNVFAYNIQNITRVEWTVRART